MEPLHNRTRRSARTRPTLPHSARLSRSVSRIRLAALSDGYAPRSARRSPPPKAVWQVKTVATTAAAVLTPVWLAKLDDNAGAVALTPALAHIPLRDGDTLCVARSRPDADSLPASYQEEKKR